MIFATAHESLYIPTNNLSTTYKHYKTQINLCLTKEGYLRNLLQSLDCSRPPVNSLIQQFSNHLAGKLANCNREYHLRNPLKSQLEPYISFSTILQYHLLQYSLTEHGIVLLSDYYQAFAPTYRQVTLAKLCQGET